MTWNRKGLEQVATQRLAHRAKLEPVERAAVAYARWQGLTDEDGIDAAAAKRALDAALVELDTAGPSGWRGLESLAQQLGDPAIIGLMRHSLQISAEQVRELSTPAATPKPEPASPTVARRRKKELDK